MNKKRIKILNTKKNIEHKKKRKKKKKMQEQHTEKKPKTDRQKELKKYKKRTAREQKWLLWKNDENIKKKIEIQKLSFKRKSDSAVIICLNLKFVLCYIYYHIWYGSH